MRVVRRGLSCDECGGVEFEKDDSGFYTCISCGVQRTEAEEKQEFDEGAGTTSRRKLQLLRLPAAPKQQTHPFQRQTTRTSRSHSTCDRTRTPPG